MGLIFAVVETGDYCKQGGDYVRRMRAMARRHITRPFRFVCLTDAPERHPGIDTIEVPERIRGWWAKLALHKPDLLPKGERIVYLDLDTLILANIDDGLYDPVMS